VREESIGKFAYYDSFSFTTCFLTDDTRTHYEVEMKMKVAEGAQIKN